MQKRRLNVGLLRPCRQNEQLAPSKYISLYGTAELREAD